MVLRIQDTGTHGAAQSWVLVLDTVLTQQTGVVPLSAGPSPTLETHSAVLWSRGVFPDQLRHAEVFKPRMCQQKTSAIKKDVIRHTHTHKYLCTNKD